MDYMLDEDMSLSKLTDGELDLLLIRVSRSLRFQRAKLEITSEVPLTDDERDEAEAQGEVTARIMELERLRERIFFHCPKLREEWERSVLDEAVAS